MDAKRKNTVIETARASFRAYLRSAAFRRYVRRLQRKPSRWNLAGWYQYLRAHLPLKEIGMALTSEGELLLGLVLMRNVTLADPSTAAPALVLGSFDFSVTGLEELYSVAERIEALRADPDPL